MKPEKNIDTTGTDPYSVRLLRKWQSDRVDFLLKNSFISQSPSGLTFLTYHFWGKEKSDEMFIFTQHSLLETWLHCGIGPSVIVTNENERCIEEFASRFAPYVSVRVSRNLKPGSVPSMSFDCNENLHEYFSDGYVLIVQDDGFPIRHGIDKFLGKYDYIGAPFIRNTPKTRIFNLWPAFAVGNGGFSLRSHKACEMAARVHKRFFRKFPQAVYPMREDVFFCIVMPLLSRRYRKSVRFADIQAASEFSYESIYGPVMETQPFGFHGARSFAALYDAKMIDEPAIFK